MSATKKSSSKRKPQRLTVSQIVFYVIGAIVILAMVIGMITN
jgi:hypothetical protein